MERIEEGIINDGGRGGGGDEGGEVIGLEAIEGERKKKYEDRRYQTYLYEKALEKNVIICLPTGSGKTFIAVRVVQHYLNDALKEGKKIIFLTPTVPLTHQQGNYMKNHIGNSYDKQNLIVKIITGDMQPDVWDGSKWDAVLSEHTIFSMTAEIMRAAVEQGRVRWDKMSLLILDECHNATKDHPMARLMHFYREEWKNAGGIPGTTLPRVVGLTATIVTGNWKGMDPDNPDIDKIVKEVNTVEQRLCCKAITFPAYGEVLKHATNSNIYVVPYKAPSSAWWKMLSKEKDNVDVVESLRSVQLKLKEMEKNLVQDPSKLTSGHEKDGYQLFWKKESPMKEYVRHIDDILEVLQTMGPYCAENCILMKKALITYESQKEQRKPTIGDSKSGAIIVQEMLKTELDLILLQLRKYMSCTSERSERSEWILRFITSKMDKLVGVVNHLSPKSDTGSTGNGTTDETRFCGIVFCEKRIIAQMVCYYLKELSKVDPLRFGFIKASFCLGTSRGKNDVLSQTVALKKQTEVLDKFRKKELNILVATKVLEEGLDVPDCNFVIRYDPIMTYQSFMQSMGRARKPGAKFYTLAPEEALTQGTMTVMSAEDEMKKLKMYQSFCVALSEALVTTCELSEREFDDENDPVDLDEMVPPFRPNLAEPQRITAGSAMGIVHRYCDTLNTDILTTLSPCAKWRQRGIPPEFQVSVVLPPNSCVREVEGPWLRHKMAAKKAAFLQVCRELYYQGMLHEGTLRPIPRNLPTEVHNTLSNWLGDEKSEDGRKVGSKKRVQWHKKRIPEEFCSPARRELSLYAIIFEMTYFKDTAIKTLMDFGEKSLLYGVVTEADLTKVPEFLLLSRDANYKVSLQKTSLLVTEEGLEQIRSFQRRLFSEDRCLLNLNHIVLERTGGEPYYVAPLVKLDDGRFELGWEIMKKLQDAKDVDYDAALTQEDRQAGVISLGTYKDALVVPSYSPDFRSKGVFCVLSVDTSMTALSPFPDQTKGATYADYFFKKYGIKIMDGQQPLLTAKPISKQLNHLIAKYHDIELNKQERLDDRHSSQPVKLIPELMRIHPLPATLYVQAKYLPSCLHRMQRLLLATEIGDAVAESCRQENITRKDDLDALQKMNDEMKKKADEATAYKSGAIVPAAPVVVENPQNSGSNEVRCSQAEELNIFTLKRKLLWVEIEYCHPKELNDELLIGADYFEDDELEASMISPPPSPSNREKCNIELIDSKDVHCEEFDEMDGRIPKAPVTLDILQAMTLSNAQDVFDLEEMEMIGDSVLKLIVTLNLFTHFPALMEGPLTAMRSTLISNRTLYLLAKKKGLGEYVGGSIFIPDRAWLPPGQQVPEKLQDVATANDTTYNVCCAMDANNEQVDLSMEKGEMLQVVKDRSINCQPKIQKLGPIHVTYTHSRLGDKSLADCVEALIGAYYITGGIPGALNFMKWVGHKGLTPKKSDNLKKRQTELIDFLPIKDLPRISPSYPKTEQPFIPEAFIQNLEQLLDYTFKEKWLLVEAFTHQSYQENNVTKAYQRLEFLGDAVLDFLITHHIYKNEDVKKKGAGQLTSLRSALVNNITFGSFAVRYNLHRLLLHFSPQLQQAIDIFAREQEKNDHKITGLLHNLLQDEECIVAEDVGVPKALGDIIESLAGAVFLDSDMSLDTTWRVFYRLMKNEIDLFSENVPKPPLQQLYEKFPGKVNFRTLSISQLQNGSHNVDNATEENDQTDNSNSGLPQKIVVELTILKKTFYGYGWNKKIAKVGAAKAALSKLAQQDN